jgi:hypothetical protein
VRKQAASEYEHRHDGLGRYLRCECAGNLGHFGQALRVATLRLGHQQARPALFGECGPEITVEPWRLLAQRTRTRERRFFAGETEGTFAQEGELFSAIAVGGNAHGRIGLDMDEKSCEGLSWWDSSKQWDAESVRIGQ